MRIVILLSTLLIYSLSTQCKDGSFCPGIQTCCLTSHGVGCCPYPDANCCGDGVHCCPNGYICYTGGCYRQKENFLTLFKQDNESPKPEKLTPNLKESPEIYDIIKCVQDLQPFYKDFKIAIENINDIESFMSLIQSIVNVDEDHKNLFDNCYQKLQLIVSEYFN
jgi:hypothetical protein